MTEEVNALNPFAVLHSWCEELRNPKNKQATGWQCTDPKFCALSLLYYKILGRTNEDLHKYGHYQFVTEAIPFFPKEKIRDIWAHNDGTLDEEKYSFVQIAEMIESWFPEVEVHYKPYTK